MSKNFGKINSSEKRLVENALKYVCEQLESKQSAKAFVDQILTEKERLAIGRRLVIASMIQQGKTYMEINEMLDVSPNTFTKIKKWLELELETYQVAIEDDAELKSSNKQPENLGIPMSYQRLKKQFPAHFLLINLAEKIIKEL